MQPNNGDIADNSTLHSIGAEQPIAPMQNTATNINEPPNSQNTKKKKIKLWIIAGCVLGTIMLVVVIILLLNLGTKGSAVVGNWACTRFLYSTNELRDNPTVMMKLKSDGTYIYGEYGNLDNNHFAGTYEASIVKKDIAAAEYYELSFGPTQEFVVNGEQQSTAGRQMSDMEIGIFENNGRIEATLIDESSYATFFCKAE